MKFIQHHLRFVLSLMVIAVFLLITLATDIRQFLYTSTNETVKIANCESRPPVIGMVNVIVTALDSADNPVGNERGRLYITHQKVNSDSCTYEVVANLNVDYITGPDGTWSYTGPEWQHDNSQDLWRIEIFPFNSHASPSRNILVKYYNDASFNFSYKLLKSL